MKDSGEIGKVAGQIWKYLDENGKTSLSNATRSLDVPQTKANMAVGWLAKEKKIEFTEEGRATYIQLR